MSGTGDVTMHQGGLTITSGGETITAGGLTVAQPIRDVPAPPPPPLRRRSQRITRSFLGTSAWMAPEVVICACEDTGGGYSFPADLWSAGVVIHSICSNRFDENGPFGMIQIYNLVKGDAELVASLALSVNIPVRHLRERSHRIVAYSCCCLLPLSLMCVAV